MTVPKLPLRPSPAIFAVLFWALLLVGTGVVVAQINSGPIVPGPVGNQLGLGDQTPDAMLEIVSDGSSDLIYVSSQEGENGDLLKVTSAGRVGIRSEFPSALLEVFYDGSDAPFDLQDSINNKSVFKVDKDGHTIREGVTPTIGSCGTSASVTGSDNTGQVTVGSGTVTSCNLFFNAAFSNAPSCIADGPDTSLTYAVTSAVDGVTVLSSGSMAADVLNYQCIGL